MPCFKPLEAFRTDDGQIVFSDRGGHRPVSFPCGQCIGCRVQRSQAWATRIMHEASQHDASCFLTLTYSDEQLPGDGSLRYRDFQKFMRRLRKNRPKVRFFMCGEYGDQLSRPHYHACVFGLHFADQVLFSESGGNRLYTSAELDSLWRHGFATIGALSFESAAYVARYCLKKVTGDRAEAHYQRLSLVTGEIYSVEPEFARMSLKPGIGANWFDRYHADIFTTDAAIVGGRRFKPPRYYDKRFTELHGTAFDSVSYARFLKSVEFAEDCTPERLAVREACLKAALNTKNRNLEK